jgi:hypothetical protein
LQQAEKEVNLNDVGGLQFTVNETGYLDEFFRVYASEDTHANVLSFVEVEDHFPIMYVPQESFMVHLPDHDILFEHTGKMYVTDLGNDHSRSRLWPKQR